MRILYHHRIASKDGQITHIEEMVDALRDLGHEVLLVGPDVHRSDVGSGGSAGWVGRLKSMLPPALYELAEIAYALVAYRRLNSAISHFKPDFIYERYALFQPAGVLASRRKGIPLLLEVNSPYASQRQRHDGLRWSSLATRFEQYTIRNATRVLVVSRVLAEMLSQMGVDSFKISVIPNAVNPSNFAALPSVAEAKEKYSLQGRLIIGFIGFVRPWDRLDRILNWMATRGDDDKLTLMIVGDGPARASLEILARKLGIAERLIFTGVVPRTEVPAVSMAFDIALQTNLLPYISPLCLFEYMALGKAIVAPNQPNHWEILRDRVDCVMYEPSVPGSLENQLDALVDNPQLRQRLGETARKAVDERKFFWKTNAERVSEVASPIALSRGGASTHGSAAKKARSRNPTK